MLSSNSNKTRSTMKRQRFSAKFTQQANLLIASLSAMPFESGVAQMFMREIDRKRFFQYLCMTRYNLPETLCEFYVHREKQGDVAVDGVVGVHMSELSTDVDFAWLSISRAGTLSYVVCAGQRYAHKKDMKFMEALDVNMAAFKALIRKSVKQKEISRMKAVVEFLETKEM